MLQNVHELLVPMKNNENKFTTNVYFLNKSERISIKTYRFQVIIKSGFVNATDWNRHILFFPTCFKSGASSTDENSSKLAKAARNWEIG